MAEPIEVTKKVKKRFSNWQYIKYVGTHNGRPVYEISPLSKYDLMHSFNGGPGLLEVNLENFGQSIVHAWDDWSFKFTPDPDVSDD